MSARVSVEPGFPADRVAWSRLAHASENVFLTPEWIESWWEHVEPGSRPMTVVGRDGAGMPAWLAVLSPSRVGPLRVLRFAGHGPADELGPICRPDTRRTTGDALARAIREHETGDVLVCEQLAADHDWEALLGASMVDRIPSPIVRFEHSTWDDFLAARTGSFRSQLRRDRKAVETAGPHRVELAADAARVNEGMNALFAMHRERWGGDSGFMAGGADSFHRRFAQLALQRGWLRLWLLEIGGTIEAVWYGFRFAGSDAHYQSGRFGNCPDGGGSLLIATAMQAALEDGMREYRFLRGGEAYKRRWANGGFELQTLVTGMTPSGRAAAAVVAGARRRGARGLLGRFARRLVLS